MKLTIKHLTVNFSDESAKVAMGKHEFAECLTKVHSGLGVPDEELRTAFEKAYDLIVPVNIPSKKDKKEV